MQAVALHRKRELMNFRDEPDWAGQYRKHLDKLSVDDWLEAIDRTPPCVIDAITSAGKATGKARAWLVEWSRSRLAPPFPRQCRSSSEDTCLTTCPSVGVCCDCRLVVSPSRSTEKCSGCGSRNIELYDEWR